MVPLYISALYKVMKEKELHENCIQQMYRLFTDHLYNGGEASADGSHLIRIDDWEMREDVQIEVIRRWNELETGSVPELADLEGYREDFFHLFGFQTEGVDYEADTDPAVEIPNQV
ncbi:putative reductase [compost metagenome]